MHFLLFSRLIKFIFCPFLLVFFFFKFEQVKKEISIDPIPNNFIISYSLHGLQASQNISKLDNISKHK